MCFTVVERRDIGIARERADLALDREFGDPLDQLVARLPVGDQVGDRDLRELVLLRRTPRPAARASRCRRRSSAPQSTPTGGRPARRQRSTARLGMAGAHQHAALLRDQREDVAGPHEVVGAAVAVGERAHRVGALLGRDAGGQAVAHVHRDGEGGAERRVVRRHHRIEMQALRLRRPPAARRRCPRCGG